MLNTEEHIIIVLNAFFLKRLLLLLHLPGVFEVILAHSDGVEDRLVLTGLEISHTEELGLV